MTGLEKICEVCKHLNTSYTKGEVPNAMKKLLELGKINKDQYNRLEKLFAGSWNNYESNEGFLFATLMYNYTFNDK